MKAIAPRRASRPGAAAGHRREGAPGQGPAFAGIWLALPGVAVLTLGVGLPAVAPATRVGLAVLGLLLVGAGGLVCKDPHEVRRSPHEVRPFSHSSCAIHSASRFISVLTHR